VVLEHPCGDRLICQLIGGRPYLCAEAARISMGRALQPAATAGSPSPITRRSNARGAPCVHHRCGAQQAQTKPRHPTQNGVLMTLHDVLAEAAEFEARQRRRCQGLGIEVPDQISHLAVRTRTWASYVDARDELEKRCEANLENVWNGRPISKILLNEPLSLDGGRAVDLIELIPPPHQRVYKMGLEHVGYVVGDDFEQFRQAHLPVLTGQQFQTVDCTPVYVLFDDYTHVKFYARSLMDYCLREGASFSSTTHAAWTPIDDQAGPYALA
jgi:predicted metalloenzyme YecM